MCGIVNANESESKTKKHPREYLTLKIDSNAKTGGFFGGELGLGIYPFYDNAPQFGFQVIYNAPSFNINLIGGHQWYFYNHPNFSLGVRAKGSNKAIIGSEREGANARWTPLLSQI